MQSNTRAKGRRRAKTKPNMSGTNGSPCTTCAKRDTCETICDGLKKLLPAGDAGARYTPVDPRIADQFGGYRDDYGDAKRDLFKIFFDRRHKLTDAQWNCVELYYGQDLSTRKIAGVLGVSHQAVVKNLALARRNLIPKWLPDFLKGERARTYSTLYLRFLISRLLSLWRPGRPIEW